MEILIHDEILNNTHLSNTAKIVYFKLVAYAYKSMFCFPSVKTLAKSVGKAEVTILRATQELRDFGLIKIFSGNFGESNRYVIMPLKMVKNLWVNNPTKIPENEGYIHSQEDFNMLIDSIREFTKNSIQSDLGVNEGVQKSTEEYVEELREKINSGDTNLTDNELITYYYLCMYDKYGNYINFTWGTEKANIKNAFPKKLDFDIEMKMRIIKKFVEVYDSKFSKGKYTKIELRYLGLKWLRGLVLDMVKSDIRAEMDGRELDLCDEKF